MSEHLDKIELYLGQVCQIAGISKMQLDYWTNKAQIPTKGKKQRIYDMDAVETVMLIKQAKDKGLVTVLADDFVNGDQPTAVYRNRNWATKNPELAAGFLRAYLKAVADLESGGWQDAAVLTTLEKYTTVPADVIKRANRPYNDPAGKLNLDSFRNQETFFRQQGLLTYEGQLDFAKFMTTAAQ